MEANWNIKHGARNNIDLSYPIEPDMTLLEVYRPLIIKDNNPHGRHVDQKTSYPELGYYARTIYQMSEGHGTHVEAAPMRTENWERTYTSIPCHDTSLPQ